MALRSQRTSQADYRDPRQLRSQAALTTALLALLEEKPFDQITIQEIAARAAVGYATFFRHYPDKLSLLNEIASEQIGGLMKLARPMLEPLDSRASAMAVCAYVHARRKLWAALLTGGAAAIMREEFTRHSIATAAERKQPAGQAWLPSDLAIPFGIGGAIDVLSWWLRQEDPVSLERAAELLDHLVITPVATGTARTA